MENESVEIHKDRFARRSCCLGCAGAAVVLVLLLAAAVFVLDSTFGLFSPADHVALDEMYGVDHPVVARLDLTSDYLKEVTGRTVDAAPWFVELVWPHEALMFIGLNSELTQHDMTVAISTRRFGSLLSLGVPFAEDVPLGGGYSVSNIGIDHRGVLTVLAGGPVEPETSAGIVDWRAEVVPYALSREHMFEAVVDNSRGHGYLALRRMWGSEVEGNSDEAPLLPEYEIDELFRAIGAFRMTVDLYENRGLKMVIESRHASEEDAGLSLPHFQTWMDNWAEVLRKDNATLEGELVQDGTEIRGEYILLDVDGVMVERSQERLRRLEQQ